MVAGRQLFARLAIVDVVLFLVAAVFNDRSATSVDGVIWWLAIGLFGVLIVGACAVLIGFLVTHVKRPRRPRTR